MLGWWVAAAIAAGPVDVAVDFAEPAVLPWFASARVVDGKGSAKGDDCSGAVALAIQDAARQGTVARIVRSHTDLQPLAATPCKQRVAGDAVSASIVELSALVFEPVSGVEPLPAERWIQLVGLLDALGPDELAPGVVVVDGKIYALLAKQSFAEPLDSGRLDQRARGNRVWEEWVPQFTARWAGALGSVPELAGAVLLATVPSEDPANKKSKLVEEWRFAIPTAAASAFSRGEIMDSDLASRVRIEVSSDPKKPVWTAVTLDVEDELTRTEGVEVQRSNVDVREEDLQGVEDEEEP
ncbi:MAG: hypothetical protein H6738_11385 [Alphaproteobacteria bacterium]|nr:hypothetical protein [Alphaproteobacteria bacterium]MCB9697373.1 hypothetical protein [Alphaproteobacteria bacterium]